MNRNYSYQDWLKIRRAELRRENAIGQMRLYASIPAAYAIAERSLELAVAEIVAIEAQQATVELAIDPRTAEQDFERMLRDGG